MFNNVQDKSELINDSAKKNVMSALKTLDAAAHEGGQEIRASINSGFKNLRNLFDNAETGSTKIMDAIGASGKGFSRGVVTASARAAQSVNEQFAARPWAFLTGFTLLGVGIGYSLARRLSKK